MTEPEEMIGQREGTALVLDADRGEPRAGLAVDQHRRQLALPDVGHARIVHHRRVEHEPVHGHVADRLDLVVEVRGPREQEAKVRVLRGLGDALQEHREGRIDERPGQRVGVDHAQGSGGLHAEAARGGIGVVAELVGTLQDLGAKLRGESLGVVVGIRDGRGRDAHS